MIGNEKIASSKRLADSLVAAVRSRNRGHCNVYRENIILNLKSRAMHADQLFAKQSTAERAPSLRQLPQQHSFVMFYMVCLQTEDSEAMKRAVAKLVRAYDRMIPEYPNTQRFTDLLLHTRNKIIENEGSTVYEDMNLVYDHINAHRVVGDIGAQAEPSDDENCDDLDETIEAIRQQIHSLEVMNFGN